MQRLFAIILLLELSLAQIYTFFNVDTEYNYEFDILLGSPPQGVKVALDYGSADLLIVPNRCTNGNYNVPCIGNNQKYMYDLNTTESLRLNYTSFTTKYVLDNSVSGFWGYDALQVGGSTFNNSVLGIRSDVVDNDYFSANLTSSVKIRSTLGLGPKSQQNCVMWVKDGISGPTYDSLVYRVNRNNPSFSVWVEPTNKQTGLVIFGGIDEQFYDPSTYTSTRLQYISPGSEVEPEEPPFLSFVTTQVLASLTTYPGENQYTQVNFTNSSAHASRLQFANVLLNSYSPLGMSQYALGELTNILDGQPLYNQSLGKYMVQCDTQASIAILVDQNVYLSINLRDFIVPANLTDSPYSNQFSDTLCALDIEVITTPSTLVLPNSILKNYFIAVDYSRKLISFAQPKEVQDGVQPSSITSLPYPTVAAVPPTQFIGPSISLGQTAGMITTTVTAW